MKSYDDDYRALLELVTSLGLNPKELSNLDTIIPRLIKQWKGPRGPLHLFITLLEKAKEKKQIEQQLEAHRLKPPETSKTNETK